MMRLLCHKNRVSMRLDVVYCCTGVFLMLLFDSIFDHENDFVFEEKKKNTANDTGY